MPVALGLAWARNAISGLDARPTVGWPSVKEDDHMQGSWGTAFFGDTLIDFAYGFAQGFIDRWRCRWRREAGGKIGGGRRFSEWHP